MLVPDGHILIICVNISLLFVSKHVGTKSRRFLFKDTFLQWWGSVKAEVYIWSGGIIVSAKSYVWWS